MPGSYQQGSVHILIPVLLLLLLGAGGGWYFKDKLINLNLSIIKYQFSEKLPSVITPKITKTAVTSIAPSPKANREDKVYALVRTNGNSNEEIFSLHDRYSLKVLRWNNLIIFSDEGTNDKNNLPNIQIKKHDLVSGKTEIIFESSNYRDELSKDNPPDFLSDLQVIKNDLYISLGGYLQEGAIYWLDLSNSTPPKQLIKGRNQAIKFMNDRYWIQGGEGDSCWNETDYSLFDPVSKSSTFIITSHSGCSQGDEVLGITQDNLIVADHSVTVEQKNVINSVFTIPLSDPKSRNLLLSKKNLPGELKAVYYLNNGSLVLVGKSVYIFDITDNKIVKLADLPPALVDKESRLVEKGGSGTNSLCFFSGIFASYDNENDDTELNLITKRITPQSNICKTSPAFGEYETKTIQQKIAELNLPGNYILLEK